MKLGIFGAGGMGREVMVAARESGKWEEILFVVDAQFIPESRIIKGCRVMSLEEICQTYTPDEIEMLICIGEPSMRKELYHRITETGLKMGCFIDPSVRLHNCTKIGDGVIILSGCIIASDVTLESNAALSFGVILGHDNHVGHHCYLAPSVTTGGFVTWEDCSFGGLGCNVKQGLTVGADAIVGQGAVVIKAVPAETTVVGNPAKKLGEAGPKKVFG